MLFETGAGENRCPGGVRGGCSPSKRAGGLKPPAPAPAEKEQRSARQHEQHQEAAAPAAPAASPVIAGRAPKAAHARAEPEPPGPVIMRPVMVMASVKPAWARPRPRAAHAAPWAKYACARAAGLWPSKPSRAHAASGASRPSTAWSWHSDSSISQQAISVNLILVYGICASLARVRK